MPARRAGRGNQLQLAFDLAVPDLVLDAARLKQVLHNLLANACAATHNGVITLGLRSTLLADAHSVRLDVSVGDTGRGMRPRRWREFLSRLSSWMAATPPALRAWGWPLPGSGCS